MRPFSFKRAADAVDACKMAQNDASTRFIAGGTNLIDLMKVGGERPNSLVDISRLPLTFIRELPRGGVSIGALARNSDTANHPLIRKNYPMLTQAILAGASPQIRNMATNGGNLMQRTRCPYFYELSTPCNKREAGTGCSAREGHDRYSAILGWSDSCVAVHPSDMCVALAALDAVVNVRSANRERQIKFAEFHRLPGDLVSSDNSLQQGEMIVSIDLPKSPFVDRSHYLKVRERSSYAFALVSVAAALDLGRNGVIRGARIALGGVAHKPWRATEAEALLVGKPAGETAFREAAKAAMAAARPLAANAFKVKLAERSIVRALLNALKGGTP